MAGEIIRLGDTTSHNGTVIEGSQMDICMGKPIAYIGHKVHCPKCRGDFPIVEGVMTTTFYGKGVALAGMKTSCGAVLIASQFTDTVEWGGSAPAAAKARSSPAASTIGQTASTADVSSNVDAPSAASGQTSPAHQTFDEQFVLVDEDANPLANAPYSVRLASGELMHRMTDESGMTERYATDEAQKIEVFLGHV